MFGKECDQQVIGRRHHHFQNHRLHWSKSGCSPIRCIPCPMYPHKNSPLTAVILLDGWVIIGCSPMGWWCHFEWNKESFMVKSFKRAGYATCIAGKWQIGWFRVEPDALPKVGFDEILYVDLVWKGGIEAMPRDTRSLYLHQGWSKNV